MKFRYTETLACWVTWVRETEAETLEEAQEKFDDGDSEFVGGPEIGDNIDGYDSIDNIEEMNEFVEKVIEKGGS